MDVREHVEGVVVCHLFLPLEVLQRGIEGKFVVVFVSVHVSADEIIDGSFGVLWLCMQGVVVA